MPIKIDETGKIYGNLTVIEKVNNPKKNGALWKCQCICGKETIVYGHHLRNGKTTSCGCTRANNRIDLTGKRFGKLVVIGNPQKGKGSTGTKWKCLCDCGKTVYRYSNTLKKEGSLSSCGCMKGELISKNLTGQHFGKLTAIEKIGQDNNHNNLWKCQCECGNYTTVRATSLNQGETLSCGCLKSSGNAFISKFLMKKNINFIAEYSFPDCLTEKGNLMRFDFCILNNDGNITFLIEYDGIQHFKQNLTGYMAGQYELIHSRDKIKDNYCLTNNIKLVRISYKENLQQRMEEILNELFSK